MGYDGHRDRQLTLIGFATRSQCRVPLAQNDHGSCVVVGIVAAFTTIGLWIVVRRRD
jgi:hypothetical protein